MQTSFDFLILRKTNKLWEENYNLPFLFFFSNLLMQNMSIVSREVVKYITVFYYLLSVKKLLLG